MTQFSKNDRSKEAGTVVTSVQLQLQPQEGRLHMQTVCSPSSYNKAVLKQHIVSGMYRMYMMYNVSRSSAHASPITCT